MSKYFPALPRPTDFKNFCRVAKEIIEKGLGRIGQKNPEGKYYEEWITRRTLIDEILSSDELATAISYTISVTSGLNDPVDTVIVGGVITVTGSGMVTAESETGTTDQVDQISGLSKGGTIYLFAASGHTLTIAHGTYLKLPSPTWTLTGNRVATFDCIGGGICVMRSHEANRT